MDDFLMTGLMAARWTKVLTSFEILNAQLDSFNRAAEEAGCPPVDFEGAFDRWVVAHDEGLRSRGQDSRRVE